MNDAPLADDAPLLAPPDGDAPAATVAPGMNPDGSPPIVPPDPNDRPDWVPEKFWDPEKKSPRVEQLAKSYAELEKKLSQRAPAPSEVKLPDAYEVKLPEGFEGELADEDVKFFKDMGFDNDKAQKAVDYLYTSVVPALQQAKAETEATELAAEWGMKRGDETFNARLSTLRDWAYQQFPEAVVKHMSRTASGVNQLWSLMQKGDAGTARSPVAQSAVSSDQLQSMMSDPRYWNGDAAYIAEVEAAASRMR